MVFKEDFLVFIFCNDDFVYLDDLVNCYNFILLLLIDCYVFLNKRIVVNRLCVFWIDCDIKVVIRER